MFHQFWCRYFSQQIKSYPFSPLLSPIYAPVDFICTIFVLYYVAPGDMIKNIELKCAELLVLQKLTKNILYNYSTRESIRDNSLHSPSCEVW